MPEIFSVLLAGACERRFQPLRIRSECSEYDVDVSGPEGLLPMFGAAFAGVAQKSRAGSHALLKLRRETVERCLRHTQCFEALKTESDAYPVSRAGLSGCAADATNGRRRRINSRPALPSSMRNSTYAAA